MENSIASEPRTIDATRLHQLLMWPLFGIAVGLALFTSGEERLVYVLMAVLLLLYRGEAQRLLGFIRAMQAAILYRYVPIAVALLGAGA